MKQKSTTGDQFTQADRPMPQTELPAETPLLDLLRKQSRLNVRQLAERMGVTATAVRQRLTRLMAQGLVGREVDESSTGTRGRPRHVYVLTEEGLRQSGSNFADLAMALWQEIRKIEQPEVRRGLLARISAQLAETYADQIQGDTVEERMEALVKIFEQRRIPFDIDRGGELPILTALACPYPELAEKDRSVCAMEKQLFTQLLGEDLRLSRCRLDGEDCCTFELREKEPTHKLAEPVVPN